MQVARRTESTNLRRYLSCSACKRIYMVLPGPVPNSRRCQALRDGVPRAHDADPVWRSFHRWMMASGIRDNVQQPRETRRRRRSVRNLLGWPRSELGGLVAAGAGHRCPSVRTKKSPFRAVVAWASAPGRNESHAEGPATACLRALMAWQTTPRRVHAFSAPTCLSLATV